MNRRPGGPVRDLALVCGFLLVVVYLSTEFLARPWVVHGNSMEPTLGAGDRVVVDLWTYRHRRPRPGEIVLIEGVSPDSATIVKRVAVSPEGYSHDESRLWVLGDNPASSADSRQMGWIPLERILGRVALLYWPPIRAGRLPSAPPGSEVRDR
jgi:signal peptidase I